jgi:hypothetical protein
MFKRCRLDRFINRSSRWWNQIVREEDRRPEKEARIESRQTRTREYHKAVLEFNLIIAVTY